jgi:methyl-accepting chemotaxis protein
VTHIAALARENSARVAATGHTVQQLAGLAGELHTAVSYFRV